MIQKYKDGQSNILIIFSSFNLVYTDSSPPNCCQLFVFLNSIVKFSKLTLETQEFWYEKLLSCKVFERITLTSSTLTASKNTEN